MSDDVAPIATNKAETEDRALPPDDFVEGLLRKADLLVPQYLATLEEAASNKGRKTVRIQCSTCGKANTASVEVADPEQTRKNLETLTSLKIRLAAAQREQGSTAGSVKLLHDRSELTDAQLAGYIDALEAELSTKTTSVDRELADAIGLLNQEQRAEILSIAKKFIP